MRTVWWTLHRWIGVGLCVLLVPIAVSGALLVWKEQLDALIHPGRYAVTGAEVAQSTSAYLASAARVLPGSAQPMAVRFPQDAGWPVTVLARGPARAEGGPPRLLTVYLDPPTGRVLEVVDFRSSLFGILHRFHENLTIPEYSGRGIGGWAGIGMLLLSVTGIWLWWPRNGAFLTGLRWRRAGAEITNLHHLLGFWISLPLALVSLTGIYLAFPQTARSFMSTVAPMTPQGQRPLFGGQIVRETLLTPERVLDAALNASPGARPAAVFLATANAPAGQAGRRAQGEARGPGEHGSPIWRIQLRKSEGGEMATYLVDDNSGVVQALPDALAGDRAAQWMRWIHDGSRGGRLWQFVVFLTGALPLIFAVTGVTMWLRGRRTRTAGVATRSAAETSLQAAE